jgi:two-component system nitrogen regulation response regulator NtrX
MRINGSKAIDVDVRIIAATNRNLEEMIKKGEFRDDLYFRLNVIPIYVPPLRERKEDLFELIDYFYSRLSAGRDSSRKLPEFSPEAKDLLSGYGWPGNIRELKNFIERVTILADEPVVSAETAKYYLGESGSVLKTASPEKEYDGMKLTEARDLFEKRLVERRLEENSYNIARTAQALGVYPSNLHGKIKKYGIEIKK